MARKGRHLGGVLAAVLLALALVPSSAAAADGDEDLAALIDQYSPRVVVRDQSVVCGPGEPYQPTAVTDVLGRPDVVLRTADGAVIPAPQAADLAVAGADSYLDLPGDPLNPGCDYQQWSDAISATTQPTLYAHLVADPGHPGMLALQFWFYWVFNDWNNRHEGDWEMVQLVFDAATPAEALQAGPSSMAFAQHEGSETSQWEDPKLRKDGTHPVVYPSEGSHAAYYDQAHWFGKSAAAGFGCDSTAVGPDVPGVLWHPAIEVVPANPASDPSFAWLAYEGHWGQQAPSFNNGPTGPNTKRQWTEPVAWQLAEGRDGAVPIPRVPGPALGAFCTVTTEGSLLFLQILDRPLMTLAVLAVVVIGIVLLVRSTTWRGADVTTYDRERSAGQTLGAALLIYARRFDVFAVIGAVFLAGFWLAGWLAEAALAAALPGGLTDTAGAEEAVPHIVAQLLGLAIRVPIVLVVVAASMAVVSRPPGEVGARRALQRSIHPLTTIAVLVGSYTVVAVLAGTVLLLPVALVLAARWAAAGPAASVEGRSFAAALRRSANLTDRRRLRTLAMTALMLLLVIVPGPLLGALLLLLTNWPFAVLNAIVAVAYAVTLPVFGVALTMQFYDLRRERAAESAPVPVA